MAYSRRKFMQAGVLAAVCAGLPLKSALAQNGRKPTVIPRPSPDQLDYYTRTTFTPYVNTVFRVHLSGASVRDLTLIQVGDYPDYMAKAEPSYRAPGNECFSLLFKIEPGQPFDQNTYVIEHAALGTFQMFLVPVSGHRRNKPDYYEAIIYRRQQSAGFIARTQRSIAETQPTIEVQPVLERVTAYNFEGKKIEGPVVKPARAPK
jgi:hypothetical protein